METIYYTQALDVDFIKKVWEIECYAKALKSATDWGNKIDKEKKGCHTRNRMDVNFKS